MTFRWRRKKRSRLIRLTEKKEYRI